MKHSILAGLALASALALGACQPGAIDARIADASDRFVARCSELRTAAAAIDLFAPEKLRTAVRQGDTVLATVCAEPPRTAADLAIAIGKTIKALQAIEAAKRA